jgi:hypothetical protein
VGALLGLADGGYRRIDACEAHAPIGYADLFSALKS